MPNNVSIKRVRSVIEELDRDGDKEVFPDDPNVSQFRRVSIRSAEGASLREWVIKEKVVNSIEIGLAFGFSALHICEGLLQNNEENAKHTIIDAFQTQKDKYDNVGLNILARAGLDRIIEFHGEKSQLVLPHFLREGRKFDFGYIDGCHLFDYVFLDLFYLGQLIKMKGIIYIDDLQYPAFRKATSFFLKNLDWKIEEKGSDKEREWLVMRTSQKQDKRHFKYFIDF